MCVREIERKLLVDLVMNITPAFSTRFVVAVEIP